MFTCPHPLHNAPAAAFNRNKRTRITVSLRCLQPPRRFFFNRPMQLECATLPPTCSARSRERNAAAAEIVGIVGIAGVVEIVEIVGIVEIRKLLKF